jgi:hypothetical protein
LLTLGAVLFAAGLVWIVALLSTTGLEAYADEAGKPITDALGDAHVGCGIWSTLLGALLGCIGGFRYWTRSPEMESCEYREAGNPLSVASYNRALVGLGYTIVLLGTLNFVALAGFAQSGHLDEIFQSSSEGESDKGESDKGESDKGKSDKGKSDKGKSDEGKADEGKADDAEADDDESNEGESDEGESDEGESNEGESDEGESDEGESDESSDADSTSAAAPVPKHIKRVRRMIRVLLLPGYAILGALFFVAGTLRAKRDRIEQSARAGGVNTTQEDEDGVSIGPFSGPKFWGGLWYRLGEGILFSLVLLLLVGAEIIVESDKYEPWLLVLALMMGMFVKPAELMINGLAHRLFKAVETFVK